jgi:hypothetical protein
MESISDAKRLIGEKIVDYAGEDWVLKHLELGHDGLKRIFKKFRIENSDIEELIEEAEHYGNDFDNVIFFVASTDDSSRYNYVLMYGIDFDLTGLIER